MSQGQCEEWRSCQAAGWRSVRTRSDKEGQEQKPLTPHPHKDGYVVYFTHGEGKFIHLYAHQAVAFAWYGSCLEGMEVDHKNKVRDDNHYRNLQYVPKAVNLRQRTRPARCPQCHPE